MKRSNLGLGATLAAPAALVAALVAAPSGATVLERLEAIDEPYADSYECGTTTFEYAGLFNGRLILRQGMGPATEAFPVLDRFSIEETHTNTETGASFTWRAHGILNEVKARPVDGDVFEFRAIETGQTFTVVDAEGNVVLRDRGAVEITFLFDTLGDGMPGGEYLEESAIARGPHPSWDLDWCAMALELTAG